MNRISRLSLSLSLILAAPGLAPYQAAAQTMAARVVAPGGQAGVIGAVIGIPGISASILPSASLQTSLVPALSPSVALTPVLSAPAALNAAGAIAKIVPVEALIPSALKAVIPAAATPEKIAGTPVHAIDALKNSGTALTGRLATESGSGTSSPYGSVAALDALFDGSTAKPEALAVPALQAAAETPRLEPSDADGSAGKPGAKVPNAAPSTSVKRTLSIGFLAAVIPIAITMGSIAIAQAFGYQLHPNYQGPMGTQAMTFLQAVAVWIGAAVMAPVSEEAIFRGGLQGRLAKLSAKLHLGNFIVPALITSVLFVALHETSDPLLFATRLVHAMILSHVYRKEGILASMAAHGFFNGLLALSLVFTAAGLPILNLAIAPVAIFFAWRARRALKAQQPAVASGALAPKPMTAGMAFLFAGLLILGYLFLMPNIFWPLGAVALVIAGIRKMKKA